MHRFIFVLAGESGWQHEVLKNILAGYEQDSLWVGEHRPNSFPFVEFNKVRAWLGKEKRVVIFDANQSFQADSFAAISGIVLGGGLFILLLPPADQWNEVYATPFGQRLLRSIHSSTEIVLIQENDQAHPFNLPQLTPTPLNQCSAPFLTLDQQSAVAAIQTECLNDSHNPVVLISDRGRGKSAALGIAAAGLIKEGLKHIVITAPRLSATDIIFKHIAEILPAAEISRGKAKLGNSSIEFYSPDQLLQQEIKAGLLMVDEAAAIPVPILSRLLEKYTQCVYATTVHGYEGTGRGFAVRFNKILNETKPGWIKCQMQMPVRWAENDPLEKWMFNLLCLDAEIVEPGIVADIDNSQLAFELIKPSALSENGALLKEVFSLLVLSHYRTQPTDLVRLLDDESLSLYIGKYRQHILALALVSHEGEFSEELSTKIYRGKRRPPGHLLAQALTYHCGVESAATLNYSRVMRIAVHPEYQNRRIGTQLLDFVVENEKKAGYAAIGSSFGMNRSLLQFWLHAGFHVVRIGFKREQTSGEHAAIMLLALNSQGEDIYNQAKNRFDEQLSFWFKDVLKDISPDIKKIFAAKNIIHKNLTTEDFKDLESYIKYSRNFELCIAAVSKFVLSKTDVINQKVFPHEYREIIELKVVKNNSWQKIVKIMNFNGRTEAQQYFHQAVQFLWRESDFVSEK